VEARYYTKIKNKIKSEIKNKVKCGLCRHGCEIVRGKRGICRVRENRKGELTALTYGKPVSISIDPIEKKPLFHFYPGSRTLSYATCGCNFRCSFCQNWQISQDIVDDVEFVPPDEMVLAARAEDVNIISHTYTEPTVFFEYAYDICELSNKIGMKNVFVTNGYISAKPLKDISPYLDAANIDLKAFNEKFYRDLCGAKLDEVLKSIKLFKKNKIWIELTNLIIPGHNDDPGEIRQMCEWIKKNCGPETPLHFSRYFSQYKMRAPTTSEKSLMSAHSIAVDVGLKYVYVGNLLSDKENTKCWKCSKTLITRSGFDVANNEIKMGRCPDCGAKIDIIS
jgi:pyruvate formate lyase activating enzyme